MTDFSSLFTRIILYLIIITLVRIVTGRLRSASLEQKQSTTKSLVHEEKTAGRILLGLALAFSAIIIFIGVVSSDPAQTQRAFLVVLPMNLLLYLASGKFLLYRLTIDDDGLYYRAGMLPGRRYRFDDMQYFETTDAGHTHIVCTDGKILKIRRDDIHIEIALCLKHYRVKERKKDRSTFVIYAPLYLKVVFIVLTAAMAVLLVLGIHEHFAAGIIFFFALTAATFLMCVKTHYDSIVVTENRLVVSRLFRKTREIDAADITAVKRTADNNADHILVYGNQGKLFDYYSSYVNAHNMDSWLEQHHIRNRFP